MIGIFVLLMVGAGAAGVYLADRHYYSQLREQQQMAANLKTIVERLTREERMAEVVVLEQTENPAYTKFKFIEVDAAGEPIGAPQVFAIEGNVAYFDSLVIEFEQNYLPLNDQRLKTEEIGPQLAGKSILVFRRVFGEKQKPEDGVPIDSFGQPPPPYKGKAPPTDFEQQLWKEFWTLANDPDLAKKRGVRAAYGDAVFTELKKDKVYVLEKRHNGSPTIRQDKVRAVLRK